MSLDDTWAGSLGDVELTMLYRTLNRLITQERYDLMPTKGEQDTAWAVKHEYEDRLEKQGGVLGEGGVF
jgi:hypothetical protein